MWIDVAFYHINPSACSRLKPQTEYGSNCLWVRATELRRER